MDGDYYSKQMDEETLMLISQDLHPLKRRRLRKGNWTYDQTMELIRAVIEIQKRFNIGKKCNSQLWEEVASNLTLRQADWEEARIRWNNLKQNYTRIKKEMVWEMSNNDKADYVAKSDWEYWELMHELMSSKSRWAIDDSDLIESVDIDDSPCDSNASSVIQPLPITSVPPIYASNDDVCPRESALPVRKRTTGYQANNAKMNVSWSMAKSSISPSYLQHPSGVFPIGTPPYRTGNWTQNGMNIQPKQDMVSYQICQPSIVSESKTVANLASKNVYQVTTSPKREYMSQTVHDPVDPLASYHAPAKPPSGAGDTGSLHKPTFCELQAKAVGCGIHVGEKRLLTFQDFIHRRITEDFEKVNRMADVALPTKYPRLPGRAPHPKEVGWSWRCDIRGKPGGALDHKCVAFSDAVSVAALPLSRDFIANQDATVVMRLLNSGCTIDGKVLGDAEVWSAVPSGPNFSSPKISGTLAAASLVANNTVYVLVDRDHQGSAAVSSACTGIMSLKPTFDLVPYDGVLSVEPTLDHVVFLGRSVACLAEVLDSAVGTVEHIPGGAAGYARNVTNDVSRYKVAILRDALQDVDSPVLNSMYNVVNILKERGVGFEVVSLPEFDEGRSIHTVIHAMGLYETLIKNRGWGRQNHYLIGHLEHCRTSFDPDGLNDRMKSLNLLGSYMADKYGYRSYCNASNQVARIRQAFDAVFDCFDLMILPVLKTHFDLDQTELQDSTHDNVKVFNVTGHPTLSFNVAKGREPVALLAVSRHNNEQKLLNFAAAAQS